MKKKLFSIGIIGVFLLIQPLNAQTWGKTKRLTWNSGESWDPAIAVESNKHIHVVWNDYTPGNWEIYSKKSTNGGTSWTTKRLSCTSGASQNPAIAIGSDDHIHVVWQETLIVNFEIFYKKSTDGGTNWTTKRLTWNSGGSLRPAIAVDSNNHIHIAWMDNTSGNREIYYKGSTDGGAHWSTMQLTVNSGDSEKPSIAVDSNNHIHVVWEDYTHGNPEIYHDKSTDGGANWTIKRLTRNSGSSRDPSIATDSNNHIHVVWRDDNSGIREIYYKKSTDGGTTWATKRLTYNSSESTSPAIALDSNNHIHVVYHEYIPGKIDIYFKKSTDGGTTWTTKRLTWNPGVSYNPVIAVDSSNNIHVSWYDTAPGNYEIYYKKGIQ